MPWYFCLLYNSHTYLIYIFNSYTWFNYHKGTVGDVCVIFAVYLYLHALINLLLGQFRNLVLPVSSSFFYLFVNLCYVIARN